MKNLDDLLVSYKQVEQPKQIESTSIELPSSRYQRMLDYLNTREQPTTSKEDSEKNTEEQQSTEELSDGFIGWKFSNPSTSGSAAGSTSSSSWSSPYSSRRNQWVSDITAAYKRAGLNDNAIKNLIAKNALESGWGQSAQGDYNFGNITTGRNWAGRFVEGRDSDANGNKISQRFRAYDSIDDYVKDEIQFLTRLYNFNQDDDFDTFIGKLQGNNSGNRRYAEDRQYANKVKQVYNSI